MNVSCPSCHKFYDEPNFTPGGVRKCPHCGEILYLPLEEVPEAYIVPLEGAELGQRWELTAHVVIGRSRECEIHVQDATLSRQHAEINVEDGFFVIADMGSRNGVEVNGKRIDKAKLCHLDVIRLGGRTFRFELGTRPVPALPYGSPTTAQPARAHETENATVMMEVPEPTVHNAEVPKELDPVATIGEEQAPPVPPAILSPDQATVIEDPEEMVRTSGKPIVLPQPVYGPPPSHPGVGDATVDGEPAPRGLAGASGASEGPGRSPGSVNASSPGEGTRPGWAVRPVEPGEPPFIPNLPPPRIEHGTLVDIPIPSRPGTPPAPGRHGAPAAPPHAAPPRPVPQPVAPPPPPSPPVSSPPSRAAVAPAAPQAPVNPASRAVDTAVRYDPSKLAAMQVDLTVMALELRGLSKIATLLEPPDAVDVINQYLAFVVGLLRRNGAVVENHCGEQLRAFWGAPRHRDDDGYRAVKAGMALHQELAQFNRMLSGYQVPEISAAVAIHCGQALAGTVGWEPNFAYTSMGDVATTAGRLVALTRPNQVLITGPVLAKLVPSVKTHALPYVELRSANGPLDVLMVTKIEA